MANRAVSTTTPVATDHASASTRVTFGSVRSVGGTFPVILVHAVPSSLRSRNTPPVIATVVASRVLEPLSFFLLLPIRILPAPFSDAPSSHGLPVAWLVVARRAVPRPGAFYRGRQLLRVTRRYQPVRHALARVREADVDGAPQVGAQQDESRRV